MKTKYETKYAYIQVVPNYGYLSIMMPDYLNIWMYRLILTDVGFGCLKCAVSVHFIVRLLAAKYASLVLVKSETQMESKEHANQW